MKTIHKYLLPAHGTVLNINLPKGSEVLTVDEQHNCGYMWTLVDTDQPIELRIFMVVGTGHDLVEYKNQFNIHTDIRQLKKNYIGTFQLSDGRLVYHVFDVTNLKD